MRKVNFPRTAGSIARRYSRVQGAVPPTRRWSAAGDLHSLLAQFERIPRYPCRSHAHRFVSMARLTELTAGFCAYPACIAVRGAGFALMRFPARAWLIETAAGPLLWDTGYAEAFLHATRRSVYRLYPLIASVTFDPAQGVAQQLRKHGLPPREIRTLVVSHFHADHYAGVRDFPDAALVCSGEAWNHVRGLRGLPAVAAAFIPELLPTDVAARLTFVEHFPERPLAGALAPFTHAWDLSGTGEVLAVPLPGHARGHLGAFVATDAGWVLLASDAAWSTRSITNPEVYGPSALSLFFQHSRVAYRSTLDRLTTLHAGGQVAIRLTHEAAE
jgi:glyoxylase-like metal-dependent hydrolase (beta-lactamase superfamily II)